MKRLWLLGLLLAAGVSYALAQSPVETNPSKRATDAGANSAAIAVTNTFQSVFAANLNRSNCIVQNKAITNSMYVFVGAIASATITKSGLLTAGSSMYCGAFGVVATDQISITGTAGDVFYASQY